jgi:beta-glucosidase
MISMALRILTAYYYVGRDTHQIPVNFNSWNRDTFGYQHPQANLGYGQINYHVDVRAEHGSLIRDHAAKSTVLLKNNKGALPFTGKEKFIAVFGDDAGDNAFGPNSCSDRGCDNGTLAMGWGSGTANFPYVVSPLTAPK